jgi:hypothetical protein
LLPLFEGWKPCLQVLELATAVYRLEAHLTSAGACYRSLKAGSRTYKSFSSLEYGSLLPFFEGWKPCLQVLELATAVYRLEARFRSVFFFKCGSLLLQSTGWKPYIQVFFFLGVRELATVL